MLAKSLFAILTVALTAVSAQVTGTCPNNAAPTTITGPDGQERLVCCIPQAGAASICYDFLTGSGVTLTRRRALLRARQQEYLAAHPDCPASQRACPLPSGAYECVDFDELTSCGGCASNGTGVDCMALPGTNGVGCVEGECVAYSCSAGFNLLHHSCEPVGNF
ncbi:hypothetical protein MNV49_002688 [Pseudohyphozyma bogoriensis]|nr:hypothetical protein MNV49_002688 [Pseudohyphozyma bogoriensis]